MTEKLSEGSSEFIYYPHEERANKLTIFHGNIEQFLDSDQRHANLLDLTFEPNVLDLRVENYKNGHLASFDYDNLDVDIYNKYIKSRKVTERLGTVKPPHVLNEVFELVKFDDMPVRLNEYVGKTIRAMSSIHEIVSSPAERITITQTRYFVPTNEDNSKLLIETPAFERWSGQRIDLDNGLNADYTIKKTWLTLPV